MTAAPVLADGAEVRRGRSPVIPAFPHVGTGAPPLDLARADRRRAAPRPSPTRPEAGVPSLKEEAR